MKSSIDIEQQEDVVVVEQRDKGTLLYIALAAILGLAAGGLIGSSLTENKWEQRYQKLEQELTSTVEQKKQVVVKVEETVANIDSEIALHVENALAEQSKEHKKKLNQVSNQAAELEKVNLDLEAKIAEQERSIQQATLQNEKLNRQADMQAVMFERSRELFQREYQVKQELSSLQDEREQIQASIPQLKTDCDAFLEGKSWDSKTDACDKQDEAQSRISHINQMIEVHTLDLKQISQLAEEMGM